MLRLSWTAVLALPLPALQGSASDPPRTEVAVVTSASNPVEGLSLAELRRYLLLERRQWPEGSRVVVLLRPSGTPGQAMLQKIVRMDARRLHRHWVGLVNRGLLRSLPSTVRDPALIARVLERAPGGLTLLEASQVPEGLKVLRVDGLLPGEEGYPLRLGAEDLAAWKPRKEAPLTP